MKIGYLSVFIAVPICAFAQTTVYNTTASRAFGQPRLTNISSSNPNLVEGREFYLPQSVVLDQSSSPPKVYVADTVNNRVLAWRNANAITKGDMADLVIGQLDLTSTRTGGPGTSQTTGLSAPTAVGVDSAGNLYIADTGNNRILRFPRPFSQPDIPQPDLVIGQRTVSSDSRPNQGAGIPSAKTLSLSSQGAARTSLVFDRQGNLWVADAGNHRVLRYPAAALAAGTLEPAADFVLGQQNLETGTVTNEGNYPRLNKNTLVQPSGIAFAESGDLYISDARGRVLYYRAPLTVNGQAATRIIGVPTPTTTDPNPRAFNGCPPAPPQPCESVLGSITSANAFVPPEGIAVLNNQLYVADTGNNRILKFDVPSSWTAECVFTGQAPCASGTAISPGAIGFIGQIGGQAIKPNQGGLPSPNSLSQPTGVTFAGTDLWVADSNNNRVLAFPSTGGSYAAANRVLGQLDYSYNAPNLVEGRELFLYDPLTRLGVAGLAVDATSDPPHLYIADTLNNRILGFRDARNVKPGSVPDLVIGQPDLLTTTLNTATRDPDQPNDATLIGPVGLVVDKNTGDLFVADAGNSRVLRFSRPFEQSGTVRANLVLGQASFFAKLTDARRNQMRSPWGLAFTQAGHLVVSDPGHNRVLLFRKPDGGDFTNGQNADLVIGQADFTSSVVGSDRNRFSSPRGIATDTSDRLYVADSNNNRISIFSGIVSGELDPSARFTAAVGSPQGIAVSPRTGEAWVTDLGSGRLLRFPIFEEWFLSNQSIGQIATVGVPLAVTLDGNDNPVIAESINRVSMYFPQAAFSNAASYVTRGLTPGMLAYLARRAPAFAPGTSASASTIPLPTTLADHQVLLNGSPVPVYQVLADRITFQVPWTAPSTGNADVELVRASTGEVLAAATFPLRTADPGFFTANAQGFGQLAAVNQDGTVNSPTNQAARGSIISLFGTGIGPINNPPPPGATPSGTAPATGKPNVSMNPGGALADSDVQYFGLVNWFPGIFQLNIRIPEAVPPSNTVSVGMFWKDYPSTEGPNGTRISTTIAVK